MMSFELLQQGFEERLVLMEFLGLNLRLFQYILYLMQVTQRRL
jgi:hypothetical protein